MCCVWAPAVYVVTMRYTILSSSLYAHHLKENTVGLHADVDVVELRAQADASMPASNINVNYTIYSNF